MRREPGLIEPLVCPVCGSHFAAEDRFCSTCRLPLIQETETPASPEKVTERHRRARKIKPQLGEGRLVRVAGGRNLTEAEFIQGLLLEEGVPSLLRRSAGFDVPDFLAAGPRDVLVPLSGLQTAREVLLEADVISPDAGVAPVAPVRLLAGLLVALMVGVLVVWLATVAVH